MTKKNKGHFKSKFGAIAVVGGSVVGLGNIWRFPYIAGDNGGAAFILVYIALSLLIAVPIMLSEFSLGRSTGGNVLRAFQRLSPRGRWNGVGYLGIASAVVILSFYSVIAGWALEFLRLSATNELATMSSEQISGVFHQFVNSGWGPMGWTLFFVATTTAIVMAGMEKGIERFNKILMPFMVLILVGLTINSFTLSGAREGISFLLKPDFSKITGGVMLQALGQAFFSLSLGMGTMITYATYIKPKENLFRLAGTVALSDVGIAILSGLAIFPAVFSLGISPSSGPELVFITLPNVFVQMTGGYFLSVVFFFLLFMAAVTSSVSLLEVMTLYAVEEWKLRRRWAALLSGVVIMSTGSLCLWSQVEGSSLKVMGNNIFDLFNNASSLYMLPIGGLAIVLFMGWFGGRGVLQSEVTSGGLFGRRIYPLLQFIIRYIAPVVIVLLFLSQLGYL